jgi:hypothetical protein
MLEAVDFVSTISSSNLGRYELTVFAVVRQAIAFKFTSALSGDRHQSNQDKNRKSSCREAVPIRWKFHAQLLLVML